MTPLPKPPRRSRRPRRPIARSTKPIARRTRPRQVSKRPSAAERRLNDAAWSRAVRAAAYGWCERCVWAGKIETATDSHHVFGKKAHPKLRHVRANGSALSRRCHRWAHAHPAAFRAEFASRRPGSWAELQSRLGRTTPSISKGAA